MSNRLVVILLALLLVAPLCFFLDLEIFGPAETASRDETLPPLSLDDVKRHAEGLQEEFERRAGALAAN